MKKVVTLLLVLTLCLAMAAPALAADAVVVSPQNLAVDGKTVECEKYNINGSNYFKLRDMAMLLVGTPAAFGIDFFPDTNTVAVTRGAAYESVGTELKAGADNSASCVPSVWKLVVDGVPVEVSTYNIGGSNFYKLRDMGDAVGFAVDYDPSTNTAIVYSDGEHVAVASGTPFFEGFSFSAPAEQPTRVDWYMGDSHDAQGGEVTTGAPVITYTTNGNSTVTYHITYTVTGKIEFPTPKNFKSYGDLGMTVFPYGAFDYYTGVSYNARALSYTDRFDYDTLISIQGKPYTVHYSKTVRDTSKGERTYSTVIIRQDSTEEMEITAPADYDGLVIALRRGGPTYYYMNADERKSSTASRYWNDYDRLSDWVFIRVSDYAQPE